MDKLCIYQCNKHELRISTEPLNRKLELTKGKLTAHLMVYRHFSSDQISKKKNPNNAVCKEVYMTVVGLCGKVLVAGGPTGVASVRSFPHV